MFQVSAQKLNKNFLKPTYYPCLKILWCTFLGYVGQTIGILLISGILSRFAAGTFSNEGDCIGPYQVSRGMEAKLVPLKDLEFIATSPSKFKYSDGPVRLLSSLFLIFCTLLTAFVPYCTHWHIYTIRSHFLYWKKGFN